MSQILVRKLTRPELIQLMEAIFYPKKNGLTQNDVTNNLNLICINCPDPSAAMDIITETPPPTTPRDLIDRALACPRRDIETIPVSKLAINHPLRKMKVDANT
jgi:hypothetical protein